jgi:serine/threonine protein kinase
MIEDYGFVEYSKQTEEKIPYFLFPRYYVTLEDLNHSSLSFKEKLPFLIRLCDPLTYMHEHGLVYRDMKPQNVPIVGCNSFLSDFGCMHGVSEHAPLEGTEGYAPLEQYNGISHPASDVWSMGVLLYQFATKMPSEIIHGPRYRSFLDLGCDDRAEGTYYDHGFSPDYFQHRALSLGLSEVQVTAIKRIFPEVFINDYSSRLNMPQFKDRLIDLLVVS